MDALDVIAAKRAHLQRLANTKGAAGEATTLLSMAEWIARPKGAALRAILNALADTGIHIKGSSFDAIASPGGLNFNDLQRLRAQLATATFVEIKTANQARVRPGFAGFFFALTESEITAAAALGERHRVALYNNLTSELLITSVPEIMARATSTNWQVSVQL